jgi:hypothetical protein
MSSPVAAQDGPVCTGLESPVVVGVQVVGDPIVCATVSVGFAVFVRFAGLALSLVSL